MGPYDTEACYFRQLKFAKAVSSCVRGVQVERLPNGLQQAENDGGRLCSPPCHVHFEHSIRFSQWNRNHVFAVASMRESRGYQIYSFSGRNQHRAGLFMRSCFTLDNLRVCSRIPKHLKALIVNATAEMSL